MYLIELSVEIEAPVEGVWRALCDPAEVVRWDSGVSQALDAPADYPRPGQHVRWRVRSGLFRELHDRPMEVIRHTLLRSMLRLGPYEMDESYRLSKMPDGTRVDLEVLLTAKVPLIARMLERSHGGPEARVGFAASLESLKRWCEGNAPSA